MKFSGEHPVGRGLPRDVSIPYGTQFRVLAEVQRQHEGDPTLQEAALNRECITRLR